MLGEKEMFRDLDEMLGFIRDEGIESIDMRLTDLNGRWRHITVPAPSFTRDMAEVGIGFDGSSVGFTTLESGDVVMLPDPTSAFRDPFHYVPTLGVICDVVEADSGDGFSRDPRGIARRAEAFLGSGGVADESRWGPEMEFYVFERVTVRNDTCTYKAELEPLGSDQVPPGRNQGYHATPPCDRVHLLRERICAELIEAGVSVKYHHHEVGSLGQVEIELHLDGLLRQADCVQIIKYFAKMCALDEGLTLTFMPKPLYGEAGSGMHFHQHLFRQGEPLFFAEGGYADLSETALQYCTGILSHGQALAALTNPSSNSYKRLVPGYEAPVNLFFSLGNRSAAIRVPKYATTPMHKRIEYRPPDGTCNPYLAMAGMLMAGIDGMTRSLDPGPLGFGPYDEDIFKWPGDRRAKIKPLPRTLDEALDALGKDRAFLEKGGVFTPDFLDTFLTIKWENECTEIMRRPHPFEFELYYDC
jgi:glutamine synthetase